MTHDDYDDDDDDGDDDARSLNRILVGYQGV
jgi:hypothetical protein